MLSVIVEWIRVVSLDYRLVFMNDFWEIGRCIFNRRVYFGAGSLTVELLLF
jgi:hypothetical protein